jgi:hypothetical protein
VSARAARDVEADQARDRKEFSEDLDLSPQLSAIIYYVDRVLQGIAMWILLMDVFVLAGPMGPPPNPFYLGVAMFLAGWLMVRTQGTKQ